MSIRYHFSNIINVNIINQNCDESLIANGTVTGKAELNAIIPSTMYDRSSKSSLAAAFVVSIKRVYNKE